MVNGRTFVCTYLLIALNTLSFSPASAWNGTGHKLVAYIAYNNSDKATQKRIDELVSKNPEFPEWQKSISKRSKVPLNIQLFMISATWPDQIRGIDRYTSDKNAKQYKADNTGYFQRPLKHESWHFCDQPFTRDGSKLPAIEEPNAKTQIAECRRVLLSDTTDDDLKSFDLIWLTHMVGDVHQPLHSCTRVAKYNKVRRAEKHRDRGGNVVSVEKPKDPGDWDKSDEDQKYNLHEIWDHLFETRNFDEIAEFASKLPDVGNASNSLNVDEWLKESFAMAQTHVYIDPIGESDGPFQLTDDYLDNALEAAKPRYQLAGLRLANILRAELK